MSWRNESTLYRRQCGLCKKSIITVYAPESPFEVYCHDCWISDKWDAKDRGMEYRWELDFFTQFRELLEKVPLVAADMKGTMVSSDYGNYNGNCKNCYMCFAVVEGEDSYYCSGSENIKECVDCTRLSNSELCYEAIESEKNYRSAFLERSRESSGSAFLFSSSNAADCFMSKNLKNAKHVFRGKQMNSAEYAQQRNNIDVGSFNTIQALKEEFADLKNNALCKYAETKNAVDATGNNIFNSKHVRQSFDIVDSENVKFSLRILKGSRDIYDCHGMFTGELVYEGFGCGFSPYRNIFSFSVDVSSNLAYSAMCRNSRNCFGCIGLKNQEYCILNKQYSKEEYEATVPKIIEHMRKMQYLDAQGRHYTYGEFFPSELSPFSYNETVAQDYFPLDKPTAIQEGFKWREEDKRNYSITKQAQELPDNIQDIKDSITEEIIGCLHSGQCNERCTTAFRITPQELALYRKITVALPRTCPNCRYAERLKRRNPLKLWSRSCMCAGSQSIDVRHENSATHWHNAAPCTNTFETSYAPDRPEIVYCEQCYQAEVA